MSTVLATKVAWDEIAKLSGLSGVSIEPCGLDLVLVPSRDVGEYWPLVSP